MSIIGIVGAGDLGSILARRCVAAGHSVRIANSRGTGSLVNIAKQVGATAVDIMDVAAGADTVVLAIPLGRIAALPAGMFASLGPSVPVVDAANYVPLRDGTIGAIDDGMPETVWTSAQLRRPLVKAFNSISDISLDHGARPTGAKDRIALPVSGDDPEARAVVMRLVEGLGFDAVDAGPLTASWRQQLGQPAYCTDGTRDQLLGLLARARLETVKAKRDEAMKLLAKIPADFPKATLLKAGRFMVGLDRGKPGSWFALAKLMIGLARRRAS